MFVLRHGRRAPLAPVLSAALAAAILCLATAAARAGSTQTGNLRGRVLDTGGAPLPGVVITLHSDALIRDRVTVTDTEGSFFAGALPPGKYTVSAQLTGFLSVQVDALVEIDQPTVLKPITLREGELQERIEVVADTPIVDKTRTEGAAVIQKEFTDKLPVGRSYLDLAEFAPGVSTVTDEDNPNILGGTSNSNVYLVDGVSGRDPVTGTFGFNLNYDAIETVDVKLSGISAEYGQFQGGLTNVATKSGGNEFTGSVRDVITAPSWTSLYSTKSQDEFRADADLDGDGNLDYTRPAIAGRSPGDDNKTNRISTTFGGPVVPDNAWFFLAWDKDSDKQTAVLGNPNGGPFGDGTFADTFDGESALGKLTWQVTSNHRLQYQYSRDPADTTRCYGEIFFGGPCYDDYTVDFQGQGGFVWIGNWSAVWGPNVISDVKVARFKNAFDIKPLSPIPVQPGLPLSGTGEVSPAVELNTGSLFDANVFSPDPEDRLRSQYEGSVTMFFDTKSIGSHTIKIGADYQEQELVGDSALQGNGLFFFIHTNPVPPSGAANPYDINNRSYFLWYDFAPIGDGGPTNKYGVLYAQDDWQLNDHWAFNIGARFEKSINENDEGDRIIDDAGIAPRLGVSWDIGGQGQDVVKGTAARYLAGINLTTLTPFTRKAGGQSSYDIYLNLDYPNPGTPNWSLVGQVRPDPDTATFDDNLKPQAIDEYSLAYERRINPTFAMGIRAVDREWSDILTTSISYDYSTGLPRKITFISNNPDAERNWRGVILTADKRLSHGWQLQGSYVYGKSEGNVTTEQSFDLFGSYSDVPQTTQNRFGLLPWDIKHAGKLQAFWSVPIKSERHGLSLGGAYEFQGGTPYAKNNTVNLVVGPGADGVQDLPLGSSGAGVTVDQTDAVLTYFEERGSRREPDLQSLDLSLNYQFRVGKELTFETRLEIFNVTNEQKPDTVSAAWIDNPVSLTDQRTNYLFGAPTAYSQFQPPRSWRLQFALTW